MPAGPRQHQDQGLTRAAGPGGGLGKGEGGGVHTGSAASTWAQGGHGLTRWRCPAAAWCGLAHGEPQIDSGKASWASGPYTSYEEFEADVRLVVANCRYYNPPWLNIVHVNAAGLEATFERLWPPTADALRTWTAAATSASASTAPDVGAAPIPVPGFVDDGQPVTVALAAGATDWCGRRAQLAKRCAGTDHAQHRHPQTCGRRHGHTQGATVCGTGGKAQGAA